MYLIHLFSIVMVGLFLITPTYLAQTQVAVEQKCGQLKTHIADLSFLSFNQTEIKSYAFAENNLTSTELTIFPNVRNTIRPIDYQLLQNGAALAIFSKIGTLRSNEPVTLYVSTQTGETFTATDTDQPGSVHWWKLLPQTTPGQFAIFGYDENSRAFIVNVTWSGDGISFGEPTILPFTFDVFYDWLSLDISPDQQYIAYVRFNEEGENEFFIYSLSDQRFLWTTPYDRRIVSVTWTKDEDVVAIVSSTTEETTSQLIGVSRIGNMEVLADLAQLVGEDTQVSWRTTLLSEGRIGFWISSPELEGSKLMLFDLASKTLIDLCYMGEETTLLSDDTGQYLMFSVPNSTPYRLALVSTQTGDYSYLETNSPVSPITDQIKILSE